METIGRLKLLNDFIFSKILASETKLLKIAGVDALYPKSKRDSFIIHSLENGNSLMQTNEILNSPEIEALANF